ncbi:MAG: hypothetical protein JO219_07795 [Candidatus Eremiobacteraeota bacterium]|nr:hypothetical protein [Candidatus Eremiobacteraeota bacterium]MBV8366547.1 hypothetical protein [Candidatus Eremiobacteraeota bacterium]
MKTTSERMREIVTWVLTPGMRAFAVLLAGFAVAIGMLGGGCSSSTTNPTPRPSSSVSPTPTPSPTPTGATPTPLPQNFISISVTPSPTLDPTYGTVSGYGVLASQPTASPTSTPAPSQIITLPANQTVVFVNFDRLAAHTASLLVPASGAACSSYPSSPCFPSIFNNTNGTTGLPQGTAITVPQFSTGTIAESGGLPVLSAVYNTGPTTGIFFFGDFFGYQSNPPIRTVIIIQ